MYAGYRLKIKGVILPNTYVARGSYSLKTEMRTAYTWTDANLTDHIMSNGKTRTTVSFGLRPHSMVEHGEIIAALPGRENLEVEYWDDYTQNYRTGNFGCSEFTFSHINAVGNDISYDATSITLTEY